MASVPHTGIHFQNWGSMTSKERVRYVGLLQLFGDVHGVRPLLLLDGSLFFAEVPNILIILTLALKDKRVLCRS